MYVDTNEDLLADHWFFKYEDDDGVVALPENFLCDFCGAHVARHAYITPPAYMVNQESEVDDE